MLILADTGILLRLLDATDPRNLEVRNGVRVLRQRGHRLLTAPQNAGEFWNVCTRPSTSRGGLGLTISETDSRLRIIERLFQIIPETPATYPLWRHLVLAQGVMGVQVHDARLVAFMEAHGITRILTLNDADFARYPGITALTPADAIASPP
jgi:predicted nucleic acid-binding protein